MMRVLLLLAALAGPALCAAADPAGIPPDAKRTIDAVNAAWVPGLQARDLTRACAGFRPETLFVSPDGRLVHGVADFEADLQRRFDSGWKVVGGSVVQGGAAMLNGRIFEWGTSLLKTVDAKGVAHDGGGDYLAVWEKDAAGKWRITRNIAL
jgi:ketosteroid isomerase-like protein